VSNCSKAVTAPAGSPASPRHRAMLCRVVRVSEWSGPKRVLNARDCPRGARRVEGPAPATWPVWWCTRVWRQAVSNCSNTWTRECNSLFSVFNSFTASISTALNPE
jgi:hypothetical protein